MEVLTESPHTATWSPADSRDLYRVAAWSDGYFGVDEDGHLTVRPRRDGSIELDLLEIVQGLEERGFSPPVLLRFPDVLAHRLQAIAAAFRTAIDDNDYRADHRAVYPIKVNQQRHVVDEVHRLGSALGFGLEVGSKPELLAALGLAGDARRCPIVCNGFKDAEYIEGVVLARKLGHDIVPVVESYHELELILAQSATYDVEPRLGVRVKLAASGAGRWSHSAGARSKFGLTVRELLRMVERLREEERLASLELLHCHMGSQIHDIAQIKSGLDELAHVYVDLVRLGAGLTTLDVGGGLAIDYQGNQSSSESSMNYTLAEYASDVVYRIKTACDSVGVDHPTIVTECGRAMVAYSSVLVVESLGVSRLEHEIEDTSELLDSFDGDTPQPLHDLVEAHRSVAAATVVEAYHDAVHAHEDAMRLFNLGYLDLEQRGMAERLFWATCTRIRHVCEDLDRYPQEVATLESALRDTYFGNFSVFQSVPDSWALRQVFPVVPIHRLDEAPRRQGVLVDITCDSDGQIDVFQTDPAGGPTLPLHAPRDGERYFLGIFLVGAYQETLGDLHNLFGDTHVAHIGTDEHGRWQVAAAIEGDHVGDVLGYFQYEPQSLFESVRRDCERAVAGGEMSVDQSRALLDFYRDGLEGYTYLER